MNSNLGEKNQRLGRSWKTIVVSAAVLLSAGAMAACGDDEDSTALEWLFVQSSDTATMASSTSLEMPVGENPFAFTDRPDRRHVFLSPVKFIALWKVGTAGGFADDPPNAVVTWSTLANSGEAVLNEAEVVVNDVVYSEETETITYTVAIEEGQIPVGDLTYVSLFIDDAPLGASGTDAGVTTTSAPADAAVTTTSASADAAVTTTSAPQQCDWRVDASCPIPCDPYTGNCSFPCNDPWVGQNYNCVFPKLLLP